MTSIEAIEWNFNDSKIPDELKKYDQWICWKAHQKSSDKIAKIPVNPNDGSNAKTNDPATWTTFADAIAFCRSAGFDGIGFVFTDQDPFVGIDIDECIDPHSGKISASALEIIDKLDSYTEISPSGRGVHIIVQGKLPGGGRNSNGLEMYDQKRYFTVTGNLLNGISSKIEDRDKEIQQLYAHFSYEVKGIRNNQITRNTSASRSGGKFERLWEGDWSMYLSHSQADLALCKILAYRTNNDSGMMDRIFRESGLFREKWDTQHFRDSRTYGQATIEKAISLNKAVKEDTIGHATISAKGFNLTDLGNAERLVHYFGSECRYCHPWKTWLVWDGKRWAIDKNGQIKQLAKKVVRKIYFEVEGEPDERKRQDIGKHAMSSESDKRIRSLLSLAQSDLPINPDQLDVDPWLLTCLNGTIDLKTGNLLAHNREHFISQLAPVNFDAACDCPQWRSFLNRIMNGNQHLISFLQRAIGYSLTGNTSEQCLFIFYGTGANGKTTLLQTINSMLGEYAMQTPTETLLGKRRGAIPNDVARLQGARFVTASEAESEQRIAESLIKQMTGGDTLSARFLHQEWFDFTATHKIYLGTNHKPVIRGSDHAIWRRIKLVPFEVTIPENERDLMLPGKLLAELPGILSWTVQGCLDWQKNGLGTPDEVKSATENYRDEMDILSEFINDCCTVAPTAEVRTKLLYEAYCNWCELNGERPLAKRTFGLKLKERGFEAIKVGLDRCRGWEGISLRT